MEKILTLTQEQFEEFKNSNSQVKVARKLLQIPTGEKIGVGDTSVKISNAKPFEVYKNCWSGKNHYYIVIEPIDNEIAIAYSIYAL